MNVSKFAKDAISAKAATVAELESQIAELRKDIAILAKSLTSAGAAKVDDYKASFEGLASDVISSSLKAMSSAKTEAATLEKDFEDQVRARPLQSLGIAVAVGFLAALLTRRR